VLACAWSANKAQAIEPIRVERILLSVTEKKKMMGDSRHFYKATCWHIQKSSILSSTGAASTGFESKQYQLEVELKNHQASREQELGVGSSTTCSYIETPMYPNWQGHALFVAFHDAFRENCPIRTPLRQA
jgi:hypothetical protein